MSLTLKEECGRKLPTLQVEPRAFHQAVYLHSRNAILYLGGVTSEQPSVFTRVSLGEVLMFSVHQQTVTNITLSGPPVFLSWHAACFASGKIYVQGGYQQGKAKPAKGRPKESSALYILDVEAETYSQTNSKVCDFQTATAGHTAVTVDGQMHHVYWRHKSRAVLHILIRSFVPQSCDLGSECNIEDSPEISPIAWIQCEGTCKMWIHQFCSGVKEVPKGKWYCQTCQTSKGKRKRK